MPSSPDAQADAAFRERLEGALGPDYVLGELVGQGGFGRVYSARDRRLDRRLAIKVIRPDLAGAAAFMDRFRREGVSLARLRHHAVVPIYDIREVDGLIYYTMPFIEGPTLAHKLEQRGALPPKVAHRIFVELCEAVAATHRAGILHRDIKPANVMLEGAQERVLLTDFGISRFATSEEVTEGVVVGTPTYMAPEQFAGSGVDHRADIYSLGVVGYHLLTGRPPFSGATPTETMVMHATERPRTIRSINPSIPMLLADAVERCLEKEPAARWDSVRELAETLERVSFFREPGESAPEAPPLVGVRTAAACTVAVLSGGLAWAGVGVLTPLPAWSLWTVAGGALLLAVLCSPRLGLEWARFVARRTGRPLPTG